MSSCVWAPQCHVDTGSASFSYFSNDRSDFAKAIKMCSAPWANSPFQSGFSSRLKKPARRFRRLKDFGCAAPEKGLSGDTALPRSEPTFPVISAMIFRYHGVQNLMCSKHIEHSCYVSPPLLFAIPLFVISSLIILLICIFLLLAYKYHLKWFSHQ